MKDIHISSLPRQLFVSLIAVFATIAIANSGCCSRKKIFAPGNALMLQPPPQPGIDAFIEQWPNQNYPNRNWGDYDAFTAVAWTANGEPLIVRCLLKFDLRAVPKRTSIKKATLSLFAVSTPGIGQGHSTLTGSNNAKLLVVAQPWGEHTVTWNTQPPTITENAVILEASTDDFKDYTNIDVTAMVQNMISKPKQNHGMMIQLDNETFYRRLVFGSSDNADASKRPLLTIEF